MAAARFLFVGLVATLALSAGCGASPLPRPPYSPQPSSALSVVPNEPPPARAERVPPRPPANDVVWIDGEWSWRRRRWAWTPGRWVVQPPGATYSPWCTVRAPDGSLYFAPAVWRDAKGVALDKPPKPLVSASVEAGVVVDAEGNAERTLVGAGR
jgi:hypothetical protein